MSNKEIAVFICSSDSRLDILTRVLPALRRFWPQCPYRVYVGLNSHTELGSPFTPVCAPPSRWHEETLRQLERVDAPYLIVILDDFLLHAPVDQAKLSALIDSAIAVRMPYLRLLPLGRSIRRRLFQAPVSRDIVEVHPRHPFYSALQIALWHKNHLVAMLRKGCSVWDFEHERIAGVAHYCVGEAKPFVYDHVVEKGKWLPHASELFQRAGLVFRPGERPIWSRWRYLRLLRDRISWLVLGYSTC